MLPSSVNVSRTADEVGEIESASKLVDEVLWNNCRGPLPEAVVLNRRMQTLASFEGFTRNLQMLEDFEPEPAQYFESTCRLRVPIFFCADLKGFSGFEPGT